MLWATIISDNSATPTVISGDPANIAAMTVATRALTIASGGEPIAATAVAATPPSMAAPAMVSAPAIPCIVMARPNIPQASPLVAR